YFTQVRVGNIWLSAGQHNRKEDFYQPQFTALVADHHIVESNVGMFPVHLYSDATTLLETAGYKPNLSDGAATYLHDLNAEPEDLFHHMLAILHAPAYRAENAGALRQDWPRVPLPDSKGALQASAALGRQVAALLDVERPVPGVTEGKIRIELKDIAVFVRVDGKPAQPNAGDLDITAGWGHAGKGGVTMPGAGKTADHGDAVDIYLSGIACWRNVPKAVWEYTIGGYQVIKKWLSYREKALLGRGLTADEVRYVTEMARRIAALIALQPALNQNYGEITRATYSYPKK
ncbi:MAG: DNA methyltransferase, partial [Candidatus Rokubacteria bacterium]|nr:DNA methyltransferase [Candidatus Rokubacteria bacterium]